MTMSSESSQSVPRRIFMNIYIISEHMQRVRLAMESTMWELQLLVSINNRN